MTQKSKSEKIIFTKDQQAALKVMKTGENIFFTGPAGSGKSTVIKTFVEENEDKNVVLTAPTGIAAVNIGGATLHRTFKLGYDLCPLEQKKKLITPRTIKNCDILFIDEISMVRVDLFEYIAAILLKERAKGHAIQLICTGDFFQLSPVIKKDDRKYLNTYPQYKGKTFAFEAERWEKMNFKNIILTQVVRQNDKNFSSALDKVKIGDRDGLEWINHHAGKINECNEVESPVILCVRNGDASYINRQKIEMLVKRKGVICYTYDMKIEGDVKRSDMVTDESLMLCEGARVMSVLNAGTYQNGSLGTVTNVTKDDTGMEEYVAVLFDNGAKEVFERHTWNVEKYVEENEENEKGQTKIVLKKEVVGKYSQIPLRLAYAVTIHKSQGQTYDSVTYNNRNGQGCFADGQLYVALSRVKNISHLYIASGKISEKDMMVSQKVIEFFKSLKNDTEIYRKSNRGGARKGAGRPRKEPTKSVRVPLWAADTVREIFKKYSREEIETEYQKIAVSEQ